ncbi:MAG TPA: nucleotidyltransferase domain-containing protein [Thermodesulfovibrionia bacterium]|nr:nucleotidyltransferase domain-containing protein [Thermodesulfovibrionia bacterium]
MGQISKNTLRRNTFKKSMNHNLVYLYENNNKNHLTTSLRRTNGTSPFATLCYGAVFHEVYRGERMNEISDQIKKIIEIIINDYKPDKVILFGSRARGDDRPDSDIDILVISDKEKNLPRYKRGLQVRVKLSGILIPKDILFYTHEDFSRWRKVRQSFVSTVIREGVVLYER